MCRYTLNSPDSVLVRRFPGSDEALLFDGYWNETHLATELVAQVLELLRHEGSLTAEEARHRLGDDSIDVEVIENCLQALVKSQLVTTIRARSLGA